MNSRRLFAALAPLLLLSLSVTARAQEELTADDIVERALDTEALGFRSGQATMTLIIQDDSGDSRERRLLVRGIDDDDAGSRSVVRVLEPPAQAGQAYLFRENPDAEDDVYVFLPALDDAPRRISGSQKNGAFMGTHFTYADLESRDLRDASYTRVDDESIGSFPVYVVDAVPLDREDTDVARARMWVRQSDFIPLRVRFFDDDDEPIKTLFTEETAEDAGRTYVRRLTVRPAEGGATTMILDDVDFDADVADAEFTPQALAQ